MEVEVTCIRCGTGLEHGLRLENVLANWRDAGKASYSLGWGFKEVAYTMIYTGIY